jgi:hypothetical protein
MLKGSCLCGNVRFELGEAPAAPTACHCVQCRKQSGHYFASANVAKAAVKLLASGTLSWHRSSPKVRRGFCSACGSWLFWEPVERDWTSVALGAIEGDTGLRLERHIFVAEKGDYYDIADGLPQNEH